MCKGVFVICFQIKIKTNEEKKLFLKPDNCQVCLALPRITQIPTNFYSKDFKIINTTNYYKLHSPRFEPWGTYFGNVFLKWINENRL